MAFRNDPKRNIHLKRISDAIARSPLPEYMVKERRRFIYNGEREQTVWMKVEDCAQA